MPTKIPFERLDAMAARLRTTDQNLRTGYEELTGQLRTTMAEWGEDTDSRQAYNEFKSRCDRVFSEMADALGKIPVAVSQARLGAIDTEGVNTNTFR